MESEAAVLQVRNYNWSDIHVYLVASGQRFSLGLVTSQQERAFEIPRAALATDRSVVFVADPIGAVVAFLSEPLLVQPGDRVEWTLQNRLSQSTLVIY